MDVERARAFLLSLPHVEETQQWGDNLVYWVGDKAIGGKMFALIDLSHGAVNRIISFSAGPERFAELLERDGLLAAPYFARIHWIAAEQWSALRNSEWEEVLQNARDITHAKLPQKVRDALLLSPDELADVVAEARRARECKPKPTRSKAKKKPQPSRRAKSGA